MFHDGYPKNRLKKCPTSNRALYIECIIMYISEHNTQYDANETHHLKRLNHQKSTKIKNKLGLCLVISWMLEEKYSGDLGGRIFDNFPPLKLNQFEQ